VVAFDVAQFRLFVALGSNPACASQLPGPLPDPPAPLMHPPSP
jgi:hypothetical protein